MGEELEMLKDEVWRNLPQLTANELLDICTALNLEVEESKKSRKSILYSTVTKHLMSEHVEAMSDVEEVEVFQNVKSALQGMMNLRKVKPESVGEISGGSQNSPSTAETTAVITSALSATPTNTT